MATSIRSTHCGMKQGALGFLWLVFILSTAAFGFIQCSVPNRRQSSSECVVSPFDSTQQSPPGTCSGPIQRAILKLENIQRLNYGCPRHLIPYYLEETLQIQCGQCVPGSSGIAVGIGSGDYQCAINEYCTDSAVCERVISHQPNYNKDCPFELGEEGIASWCGPGLQCIEHKCIPCREGDIDYNTGVKCILGEWSYGSMWIDSSFEPMPLIMFALSAITLLYLVMNCSLRSVKLISKIVQDGTQAKKNERATTLTREFIEALNHTTQFIQQEEESKASYD